MSLLLDFRNAVRSLQRSPGFSAVVLVLLGAGLGMALSVGTAAWSLLVRPLPYPGGERLVEVSGVSVAHDVALGWSPGLIADLVVMPEVEAVGAYEYRRPLFDSSGREFVHAALSPDIVQLLGVRPLLGRLFATDRTHAESVLLSEATWRSHFGADPQIIGRMIDFDGTHRQVVGVLDRSFRFPSADVAVWSPLHYSADQLAHKGGFSLGGAPVLARLSDGVDIAAFSRNLDARLGGLPELQPLRSFAQLRLQAVLLRDRWVGERRELLVLLSAAVAAVLVLLFANLTALWVGRWQRRERELALRHALGAENGRLARLLILEMSILGGAALLVGLMLAEPGLRLLGSLGAIDAALPWPTQENGFTVALGLALAALVLLLFAATAFRYLRSRPSLANLAHAAAGLSAGVGTQRLLVTSQLALAIALLTAGTLLGRSLIELVQQDIGFRPQGVLVVSVEPGEADEGAGSGDVRLSALLDQMEGLPGVSGVSYGSALPFSGNEIVSIVRIRDRLQPVEVAARDRSVGVDYFKVLGVPLLRGRAFSVEDRARAAAGASNVGVLVDQRFVDRYLAGANPLSVELGSPNADDIVSEWQPIVGVVATVHHAGLDEQPDMGTVYTLAAQPGAGAGKLLVVTEDDASALLPRLRELAQAQGLRIRQATPLDWQVRASVQDRVRLLGLVAVFALTGMILSALGLFAVVSLAVQRRRAEFALRLTLGASARSVAWLALRSGLRLALPGLVSGLLLALGTGQMLASNVQRVVAWHFPSLLAILAVALSITVIACLLPARWAARSPATAALRCE